MKKSTLLSLLTATSIVLTSAGTYAAWDSLSANTTMNNTVTFRNPVTIEVGSGISLSEDEVALKSLPTASGTVEFNVDTQDGLVDTLTLTPTVSGYDGASADHFTFTITDTADDSSVDGFVDSNLDSTSYNVKVEAKEDFKSDIAGKNVKISLTATLSKSE